MLPSIKRPDEVLGKVLAELEPKSDYQVLMVQGSPRTGQAAGHGLSRASTWSSPRPSLPIHGTEPVLLNSGKTMLINVGQRGKYVGAVGFFADAAQKMRFYLVSLNSRSDNPDSPMKKVMRGRVPQHARRKPAIVESFPGTITPAATTGATFVGAETCKRCHPNTYQQWSSTKHAHAFVSLENDPKPNTIYDAECVSCHTTGFEYTSGYRSAAATPASQGNPVRELPRSGVEARLGSGQSRVSQADAGHGRPGRQGPPVQPLPRRGQLAEVRVPGYWSQVRHNGLDEYTDPKVHQGIHSEGGTQTRSRDRQMRTPIGHSTMSDPASPDAFRTSCRDRLPFPSGWSRSTRRTTGTRSTTFSTSGSAGRSWRRPSCSCRSGRSGRWASL